MNRVFLRQVHRRAIYTALILPLPFLCGCASSPAPSSETQHRLPGAAAHGYALLFDLMGDEKNVSKLLLIKRERAELRNLIKEISEQCARAHKQIEAFAKADARLNLEDLGLPAAELKTRESIGKAKGRQLLTDKGQDFEFHLLLTQNEALSYGAHLASVIAASEPDSTRAQSLQQLSNSLAQLQQRVVTMLLAHYSWPGPK